MAKQVSSETARNIARNTDYLDCGICLERLKKPKFLNCEHSYCEACLIGCTPADANKVVCPKCATETPFPDHDIGVASIPTNPFIEDILHEYTQQMKFLHHKDPSITKCEACERGNRAIACCLVCEEYLCYDCEEAHKKLSPQRAHNVERLYWVSKLDIKPKTPECNTHPGRPAIFSCSCCNKRICIQCVGIDYKPEEVENCERCHRKIEDWNSSNLKTKLAIASGDKTQVDEDGGIPPDPIRSAVTESDLRKITNADVDLSELQEALVKRTQEQIKRVEDEEKDLMTEINALENKELQSIRRYKEIQRVRALKCKQIITIVRNLIASDYSYLIVTMYRRIFPIMKKCRDLGEKMLTEDIELLKFSTDELKLVEPSKLIGRVDCLMSFQKQWGRDGQSGKEKFEWGHGIAMYPSGDIVVCDRNAKQVITYSQAGEVQFEVISPPKSSKYCFCDPCDVAITSDSFLLLVDRSNFVKIFDEGGRFFRAFNSQSPEENPDPNISLCGIAVDDKDRIAVADGPRKMITLHFNDGVLIHRFRTKCTPGFLAINSQHQILVSGYPLGKVEVLDYEGDLLFWFNCMIEGRRLMIGDIIVDTQDNIWIGMYDPLE